ncbi:MgtC/SapB family protein [Oryzomicrobium sp.]|uniref:MgtC/SapB family protein n=1 Tax=Oryzomicrobium sp. TaxID=1911578 RepID=UPI0025DFB550|nr:MgtC/SapB family protein [Oryzomicrobium sp.]MCE1244579.1 MgtC/SapB family protein [Oryzomicrobium sp.]
MLEQSLALPNAEWPYFQILIRLVLSLALGLLIGLERERRKKEAGLRTFGFICLLGALGGSLGPAFALVILLLTGMLAVFLNVQTLRAGQGTELTTSAAMLVTAVAGILCGQGHTISPAAVMVIATALLAWKERLAGFSMGLTESELRSALLLAILAIVIYPALPVGAVGPWHLVEPRAAWVTVILIAGIGFVNYVLWKVYGTRGTELSGFLGGLVNSNFTVIELSSRIGQGAEALVPPTYRSILLATTAMIARNASLLLILAPITLLGSFAPFALMMATSLLLVVWSYYRRAPAEAAAVAEINLDLPFSLPQALKYGAVFLLLHIVGGVTQRQFGDVGFYFVSVVGGLMSSASAVAAAAALAAQGSLSPTVAGTGAVLASFTSIVFSLSFVLRTRSRGLIGRLAGAMACIALAGLAGVAASQAVQPWVAQWLPDLAELQAHGAALPER